MIECRNVQKALDEVRPDIVWLTHPTQLKYLGEYTVAKIVYDCMDDYLLLGCDQKNRTEIAGMEQALCKAASFIFASSDELVTRLKERYDISGKLSLVRNGCEESLIPNVEMQPISRGDCFRLMYFGTISDWFDFEVIEESLERFPEIEYILAGPIQVANPPMNERIHYIGTVPHKKLANFAKEADCLVMPFLRTELVDAVDPVKMYEYISFQKNILCTEYPEARRFNEFAILYSDNEEYMEKLAMLIDDNHLRYKWTDAKAFLEVNTWQKRAEQISRIIG
jgi:glycosyltransferase involved in cell wall biosynthesis